MLHIIKRGTKHYISNSNFQENKIILQRSLIKLPLAVEITGSPWIQYADVPVSQLQMVVGDNVHPLHCVLMGQLIPHSGRMQTPQVSTNHHLSFIPRVIKENNNRFIW